MNINTFSQPVRLVQGLGALSRLPELTREFGGSRALLVSDTGVVEAGHVARAEALLREAGVETAIFDGVCENPTTEVVDACVAVAKRESVDFLIGIGGGSSLDTAKGCNFILTNGGRMRDYWGHDKATKPMLPSIMAPTTTGTGSECQSYALISDAETHAKMACGDRKALAKAAILDPELAVSQPRAVLVVTAIDALAHAVESMVTKKRSAFSQLFSREAFRLIAVNIADALSSADIESIAALQLGASFAGVAIENSMLGAAHSAANPLTANYDTVHGVAVGLMLPAVVRFNGVDPEIETLYDELLLATAIALDSAEPARERMARFIETLLDRADIPATLDSHGVNESMIPKLAEQAAGQWTAQFNPRPIAAADFERLYTERLSARAVARE